MHGTNGSRAIWAPMLRELARSREVVAVDLPGHGASPPTSLTPPDWAAELAGLLDDLGLPDPVAVAGHSSGGWAALELAKLGRAQSVLALAPAGLWRRESPRLTDLGLVANWRLGRLGGERGIRLLRRPYFRSAALRSLSARPGDVPVDVAVAAARAAAGTDHFPAHFAATRVIRFTGGQAIATEVGVRVIWGDHDRIALRRASRFTAELPGHARVETWPGCGHMVMWDRREATVAALLALA